MATPILELTEIFDHHIKEVVRHAKRSPCKRSKRGVVLVDSEVWTPVSYGWNHPPCPFVCRGYCGHSCKEDVIHAEMDALIRLGEMRLSTQNKNLTLILAKMKEGRLFPSDLPSCKDCSKYLLQANFEGVWLYHVGGWKFYPMLEFHELSQKYDKKSQTL